MDRFGLVAFYLCRVVSMKRTLTDGWLRRRGDNTTTRRAEATFMNRALAAAVRSRY
jgi:hypothetical protein